MEIFRYTSNAWGQRMLEGMSWDLLWLFAGAGLAFIVFHALYTARKSKDAIEDE